MYQPTMTAPAENAPIATRKSPAYCAEKLLCTVMSIPSPAIARTIPKAMKGERRPVRSDSQATMMQRAIAAATGGTECNWVCTVEYPRDLMIVGAKKA